MALKKPVKVLISFGCNIGNCPNNIERTLSLLESFIFNLKVSPIYISKPYGVLNQNDFHNGAVVGYTFLKPFELLRKLKTLEVKMGRNPRCRWCEREIDLDIIYYGSFVIRSETLTVPHIDRLNREFVLKPASDIAPTFEDPLLKKTVREIFHERFKENSRRRRADVLGSFEGGDIVQTCR